MRIALVSPYSYAYPGGVARHVEALAEELIGQGHDARVLAPHDPDDRLARLLHRGARPRRSTPPDHLVALGRTVAVNANGAKSNLALGPESIARLGRELRRGGYDLVHAHEPNAPLVSWCATELARVPLVGTFHAHSTSRVINGAAANLVGARRLYNRLGVRIAVSEAARWTAERFYGGRYRVVPNGVDVGAAPFGPKPRSNGGELGLLYLGRAEERKGLPVLLRAFEALGVAGVAARLRVAGPSHAELRAVILEADGVEVLGPVSEAEKWRLLHGADVLCAPSLGGESFGMVLTEALAAATPVVCSAIAGYRDVVRDGVEGLLVAPGRPDELAEALCSLAHDRARRERMGAAARVRAERFAWPRVTREVVAAYEEALALPAPATRLGRAAARIGARPADGLPSRPPQRLPSLDSLGDHAAGVPDRPSRALGRRWPRPPMAPVARRLPCAAGLAVAAVLGALALAAVGAGRLADAVLGAAPLGTLVAVALMALALVVRAEAWRAILRASLPSGPPVRPADTARATMIGVLMSATLPARLGELSRSLVMARRLGRVRERLPLVAGTVASQSLLNLLALALLGAIVVASVGLFRGGAGELVLATLVPAAALLALLGAPFLTSASAVRATPGESGRAPARRLRRATARPVRLLAEARRGLAVFGHPRLGPWATAAQLSAWALQWIACYALLVALGLGEQAGLGGAAAVLFAVNAAGALPIVPANLGVFQAACVAVLAAYGVDPAAALAYGVLLQALELTIALALGGPALVREGLSWREMRQRALSVAPLDLRTGARAHPSAAD